MNRKLFLVDLDLTLINHEYQTTVPIELVREQARLAESTGSLISLISDSAFETLLNWAKDFNFHGPIIAEKGALIVLPIGQRLITFEQQINWQSLKEQLKRAIQQICPEAYLEEIFYKDFLARRSIEYKGPVVIINPYRQCSFGLYAWRADGQGKYLKDERIFAEICQIVLSEVQAIGIDKKLNIDTNPLYGVLILADQRVNKRLAIPYLREIYEGHKLVMIGDSGSDAVLKGHVDRLYAVGNATTEMKQAADRVAEKEITAGFLEILAWENNLQTRR